MTTIAHETVITAPRRDAPASLRRAVSGAVAAVAALAAELARRIDTVVEAGQLGADHETEVGRWSGARV